MAAPSAAPIRSHYLLDRISPEGYIVTMAIEVICTDDFESWWNDLSESEQDSVARYVRLLEERGVTLPFPYSSEIVGSRFALRELRVQSGGKPLRVFYAFDPERQAVLLVGGDKTGRDRFYEEMIPRAERIWKEYLNEIEQQ